MVYKVTGYSTANTMKVQPISYSSNSLLSAQTNTTDSSIKTKLDSWYKTNMTSYTSYLVDETSCNDRSVSSGTGYKTDSTTYYGSYDRLANKRTPSLKCSQENDKFRVSSTNAKLDYPIGLIQADEVSLAGGVYNTTNMNYYLYNSRYFWTLSPSYFDSIYAFARVWLVMSLGSLSPWYDVTLSYGVRPVINLKADTLITKGDGSSLNPFTIKLG